MRIEFTELEFRSLPLFVAQCAAVSNVIVGASLIVAQVQKYRQNQNRSEEKSNLNFRMYLALMNLSLSCLFMSCSIVVIISVSNTRDLFNPIRCFSIIDFLSLIQILQRPQHLFIRIRILLRSQLFSHRFIP